MERLTKDINDSAIGLETNRLILPSYTKVYKMLKEYEDLEEQGKLLKLPCKVGDTVWIYDGCVYGVSENFNINEHKFLEYRVVSFKFNNKGVFMQIKPVHCMTTPIPRYLYKWFKINSIGKTIFLTESEANAKLEELKNEYDK